MFNHKAFLKTLTTSPGVYQMFNAADEVIYVGKARNLKNRVSSYFRNQPNNPKTQALVGQIARIEVIVTHSDNEAFLLENNLIKQYRPRYNILFRDDKSYAYLHVSNHPDYPRMDFYRGLKRKDGDYFGPYSSGYAVRDSLNLLQKLFKIRQCDDSFFRNRSRPCLQYQIQRCTAPCVGYITPGQYQEDVRCAKLFLQGKNQEVINELIKRMETASQTLNYELAAKYRDQIAHMRHVQEQQDVTSKEGNIDVVVAVNLRGVLCIQILSIREGQLLGNKAYFPKVPEASTEQEVLAAFLPQYYLNNPAGVVIPQHIILNHKIEELAWINQAFSVQAGYRVRITDPKRGQGARWIQLAINNAQQALAGHLAQKATVYARLEALQEALHLESLPQRIECFDISHTGGEATVASCVVFNHQGAAKNDYRRFNINGITPGDDYAAMRQAVKRRYKRIKQEEGILPDIVFIDGGKGQLRQAEEIFEELQIAGVMLIGIAKGEERKPGLETLFIAGLNQPINLEPTSLALHLIQEIRDEAHRFAILGHRQRRAKARKISTLEEIPGIGAKRRRAILQRFGGLQEVRNASIEEIAKVQGISKEMAEKIFAALH